jgi:hypothetical protein
LGQVIDAKGLVDGFERGEVVENVVAVVFVVLFVVLIDFWVTRCLVVFLIHLVFIKKV